MPAAKEVHKVILLNKEQIKEIIPHRDPFLLIDEIVEMEEGKRVVAMKYVNAEEYYFAGHFPRKKLCRAY